MRYQPTVLIGNNEIQALLAGELRLQCGQWIKLAWCDRPSRFVGVTPCTVWADHYPTNVAKLQAMARTFKRRS